MRYWRKGSGSRLFFRTLFRIADLQVNRRQRMPQDGDAALAGGFLPATGFLRAQHDFDPEVRLHARQEPQQRRPLEVIPAEAVVDG